MKGDTRVDDTIHRQATIETPDKEENEESATQKQIDYILHLAPAIKKSGINLDDLGKWQASTLIEQIINSKDQLNEDIVMGDVPQNTEKMSGLVKFLLLSLVGIALLIWIIL